MTTDKLEEKDTFKPLCESNNWLTSFLIITFICVYLKGQALTEYVLTTQHGCFVTDQNVNSISLYLQFTSCHCFPTWLEEWMLFGSCWLTSVRCASCFISELVPPRTRFFSLLSVIFFGTAAGFSVLYSKEVFRSPVCLC